MKPVKFLVTCSVDYSIVIEAEVPEDALSQARLVPIDAWDADAGDLLVYSSEDNDQDAVLAIGRLHDTPIQKALDEHDD